ncbi:sigma-54 interaction domain-containing protein [Desulfovibrio ferrophilus]|uniref:Transcriptional regulator, NifA subfamily, Fis Family n=1 Tax=Desulfovibrio ferrophilus TaxID=241368 RepID=A0A2Z6AZP2_9BACT|nr:sigma-54-dependent Fis family transcriptional regulator [Desulfovibrio ferrophilus]BBD08688.1 transcriptional regulator, NifA subfamily, Fis Family [Desulfovibrio ferrophilus]
MTVRHMNFFKLLSGEVSPQQLLLKFLLLLLELQNVERGSIWVRDGDNFTCLEAVGEESDNIKGMSISKSKESIVGWVMKNGRMTIAEAGRDKRHFKQVEEAMAVKSSLILAYPLFLKDSSVYGVIEVIDTSTGGRSMNLSEEYLDFLQNLVDIGSIALSNSVEFSSQAQENSELKKTIEIMSGQRMVAGPSPSFQKALHHCRNYAGNDYPVLVTGESGVGKEVLAREIHRMSNRCNKPFLVQNCSSIPRTLLASELFGYRKGAFTGAYRDKEGLFEAANGGTVFLDEIGDMSTDLQASLLRVLQDNEIKPLGGNRATKVDVRIISATNKDLRLAIDERTFREDLFFRLNVLPVTVPPLCERSEDIPYLLAHFIRRESVLLGMEPKPVSPEALSMLMAYPWPGNIRELENMVKLVLVSCDGPEIGPSDLPPTIAAGLAEGPFGRPVPTTQPPDPQAVYSGKDWENVERDYANHLLEKHRWVISRAAREAGLKRSTFDSRLKKLGIRKTN